MSAWPLWFRALMFLMTWLYLYVALRYGLVVWYRNRVMGTYKDHNA